jgi:hypothetical protein
MLDSGPSCTLCPHDDGEIAIWPLVQQCGDAVLSAAICNTCARANGSAGILEVPCLYFGARTAVAAVPAQLPASVVTGCEFTRAFTFSPQKPASQA